MSATIAALLVGTAAVGGFGAWAGSSSSTEVPTPKEALKQVANVVDQEEDEPSQPTPESKPITPPPTPIAEPVPEPAPEAVPAEETKEEEKVAEPVPEPVPTEPVVQGGGSLQKQDGGFGKPTWAPLNSGDSLQSAMGITKDQIGSTGSSLLSKWTGAKTAESIQLKLKEIDDQLRVLRAEEFNTKSKLDKNVEEIKKDPELPAAGPAAEPKDTLRGRYMKAYNSYLTNKTLFDYNSKLISRIVDEKKDEDTQQKSLKELYKDRFPEKADKFNDPSNKVELFNFINGSRDLPENLRPRNTKSGQKATADSWWNLLNTKTSGNKDSDSSKLPKYLSDREKSYTDYSAAEEKMNLYKDKFEELDSSIKELTPKLKNIQKKTKELLDTRELVLVELSNYELPKGMFESFIKQKPIQKPLLLPTGEQRDRIFAQIKDLEQRIKEKKEDIQDFLSTSLEPNGTLNDDNRKSYNKKMGIEGNGVAKADFDDDALSKLTEQRDKLILELEGRTAEQKAGNDLDNLVTELLKDKLVDKDTVRTNLINSVFHEVYKSYLEISKSSIEDIRVNLDKYYKFYMSGFNGQYFSSGLAYLNNLGQAGSFISVSDTTKTKVLEFNTKNKFTIYNALVNLEAAKENVLIPPEDTRSITQKAIDSGQSTLSVFLKKPFISLGKKVGSILTKTETEKFNKLIEKFTTRIFDKTKSITITPLGLSSLSYTPQGYNAPSPIESYNENNQLIQEDIQSYEIAMASYRNPDISVDRKKILKKEIYDLIKKIRGRARLLLSLIGEGDPMYNILKDLTSSNNYDREFRGGAINTIDEFDAKIGELVQLLQENTVQRTFIRQDAKQDIVEQIGFLQQSYELISEGFKPPKFDELLAETSRLIEDIRKAPTRQLADNLSKKLPTKIKEARALVTEANKLQQKKDQEYTRLNERRRGIRIQTLADKPYNGEHEDYFRVSENLRLTLKIEKKFEDERKEEYLLKNPHKKTDDDAINENINVMKDSELEEANVIREEQEGVRQQQEEGQAEIEQARQASNAEGENAQQQGNNPFQNGGPPPPAQGNPFGNAPQQAQGNPFGNAPQQAQPQGNPFGNAPQQAQGNPFGNAPQQAQPQGNPFGNAPQQAQPQGNPFGNAPQQAQPQGNPFGNAPQQAQPQGNPFGNAPQQAQGNPFGNAPAAGGRNGRPTKRINHLTRKQQWTRSKPSRFKTHRIY